jgi:hypothetical protein
MPVRRCDHVLSTPSRRRLILLLQRISQRSNGRKSNVQAATPIALDPLAEPSEDEFGGPLKQRGRLGVDAAARAVAQDDARCDAKQPAEPSGGQNDPDQRGVRRAYGPVKLD